MKKFFKVYVGPGYPVDEKMQAERFHEALVAALPVYKKAMRREKMAQARRQMAEVENWLLTQRN